MPAPVLELRDISIRLASRVVFRHTRWSIRPGEAWAILGANGSGKTTLVRAILGKLPVVRGEIMYRFGRSESIEPGRSVEHVSFSEQRGLFEMESAFHQARWFSGADDLSPSVRQLLVRDSFRTALPFQVDAPREHFPGFRARREKVIRQFGLARLLDRRVVQLSNGERRKLMLARALIRAPRLLIIDQPFVGLDASTRVALRAMLGRIIRGGQGIIIVGTDESELPPEITHIIRVRNFRVESSGPFAPPSARPPEARSAGRRAPLRTGRPAEPMIEMRNTSVRFGNAQILRGVTWTVRRGEHWVVAGPNGAGKSTLLGLISGDHPHAYDNGISLFGLPRGSGESIWELRERIGFISPELHLFQHSASGVLDIVLSGFAVPPGTVREETIRRREARRLLRALDLPHANEKTFADLSEGGQRLALLARALVSKPDVLLLDEPCQGLDEKHTRLFLHHLDHLSRDVTLIYVTHRESEWPAAVDRILRIHDGRARVESPAPAAAETRSEKRFAM